MVLTYMASQEADAKLAEAAAEAEEAEAQWASKEEVRQLQFELFVVQLLVEAEWAC